MTAVFAERDKAQILDDLRQWYAPATVAGRSGHGRKRREERIERAERTASAFFEAVESGPVNTLDDAINQVGLLLYPILWRILKPLLWRAVAEIVTWLWKRTR